jgi:hypothetical protein
LNGREGRESGLRLKASIAPEAAVPCATRISVDRGALNFRGLRPRKSEKDRQILILRSYIDSLAEFHTASPMPDVGGTPRSRLLAALAMTIPEFSGPRSSA